MEPNYGAFALIVLGGATAFYMCTGKRKRSSSNRDDTPQCMTAEQKRQRLNRLQKNCSRINDTDEQTLRKSPDAGMTSDVDIAPNPKEPRDLVHRNIEKRVVASIPSVPAPQVPPALCAPTTTTTTTTNVSPTATTARAIKTKRTHDSSGIQQSTVSDRFKLKVNNEESEINADEKDVSPTETPVRQPKTTKIPKSTQTPKNRVERLLTALLGVDNLGMSGIKTTKISAFSTASSECISLHNGTLTIHLSCDGAVEDLSLSEMVTLFCDTGLTSVTKEVLATCSPNCSSVNKPPSQLPPAKIRSQLEWLSRVYTICDPLHKFAREVSRIFPSCNVEEDPLIHGRTLVDAFRCACVTLGQALLAPYDKVNTLPLTSSTTDDNDDDDDLPPLFADEVIIPDTIRPRKDSPNDVVLVVFDMMKQQAISSYYFCAISSSFMGFLESFFSVAMEDFRYATSGPHNVFAQPNSDLFSSFPMASLNVISESSPVLCSLVSQNILKCIERANGGAVDGVEFMDMFILAELMSVTKALTLPLPLSLASSSSLAAKCWTTLLQLPDKDRLVHDRIVDIDRIVQKVRNVVFEIFTHILCVDKGINKKPVMEFFALVLTLSSHRSLGRHDDREEAVRGFEPEGRVICRHFVLGSVDLMTHLLAEGGIKIFNAVTFLERRQKELADVEVVQSLCLGELCKCNFDVFLLYHSMLMISSLEREIIRQEYIMMYWRKEIKYSRLSFEKKKELEDYVSSYHYVSSCEACRPSSIDHMGKVADMFVQYLIQLTEASSTLTCFQFLETSPGNLYQSLSYVWSSLTRLRHPSPDQVKAAEAVVFLTSELLNRNDFVTDVKQQNHWVNILNSIGGNALRVHDNNDEFQDDCVQRKDDSVASADESHDAFRKAKWKHGQESSAYFGTDQSRGRYVGAIFDSERNVTGLPVALARLYISSQSVEGWDADKDISFNKFDLRLRISKLLSACIVHPLHSEAVLNSLSHSAHNNGVNIIGGLFMSVIDQNVSNFSFLSSIIRTAMDSITPMDDMKEKYNFIKSAKRGVSFLLQLCGERTIVNEKKIFVKLSNQVLQLREISELIVASAVDVGLNGLSKFLDCHVLLLTACMARFGGDPIMQVLVNCCVDRGVRLHVPNDATGINELVAERWSQEDAVHAERLLILEEDGDCDDPLELKAQVQRALDDESFVKHYHDTVSEVCDINKSVESVQHIPGHRFKKISEESIAKGTPRSSSSVLKAWRAVAKCLANNNDMNNFHPNGTILIKYLESDASCARAVISVNMDTPYAFGLFFFDIWLPPDYPLIPPLCELVTNGDESFMLSPNLYSCGKVCMSLLNTAQSGSDIEKWQPNKSTVAQVLLTIQTSLLGDAEPLTKEGKRRGSPQSIAYNKEKHFETVRWGMLDALENGARHMGPEFGVFIKCHFSLLREQIRLMVRSWWRSGGSNWRLERLFVTLLQELKALPLIDIAESSDVES